MTNELSYEKKLEQLEEILTRLDNDDSPIDRLSDDVKLGAKLIKELNSKLNQIETEVKDIFKELEEETADLKTKE